MPIGDRAGLETLKRVPAVLGAPTVAHLLAGFEERLRADAQAIIEQSVPRALGAPNVAELVDRLLQRHTTALRDMVLEVEQRTMADTRALVEETLARARDEAQALVEASVARVSEATKTLRREVTVLLLGVGVVVGLLNAVGLVLAAVLSR